MIADVFDSITSKRVYKAAIPFDEAISLMRARHTQFDPRLLQLFLASLDEILQIRQRFPDA